MLLCRSNQASSVWESHSFGCVDLSPRDINGKIGNFANTHNMHVCGLCDHSDLDRSISAC